MNQMRFETNASPKIRLRETTESGSSAFITRVIIPEVANTPTKITGVTMMGRPSRTVSGANRRTFETARRTARAAKDGRTNRCR